MTKRIAVVGVAAFLVGVMGACSSSSSGGGTTPPGGDAGTDAPAAATGTLTLLVGDGSGVDDTSKNPNGVAGANIVFYPPGDGDPITAVSGADGTATLTGIDWSKGTGSILVYKKDRSISFATNVSPDVLKSLPKLFPYDGLVIGIAPLFTADDFVDVTGKISNAADPKHIIAVGASTGGSAFQGPQGNYAIRVPKGKAGSLLVTELQPGQPPTFQTFAKFAKIDLPAASAPTKIDIDLSTVTALPTTKTTRTLTIPGGAAGPLGGAQGYLITEERGSNIAFGAATKYTASADGASILIDVEVPTDPGLAHPMTINVLQKTDGTIATSGEQNLPADGVTVSDFKDVPAVTVTSAKLSDPIQVDGIVADGLVGLQFFNLDGEVVLQGGPLGKAQPSTTITVPKLPADAAALLGTTSLTGRATATIATDIVPGTLYVNHFMASRQFAASK